MKPEKISIIVSAYTMSRRKEIIELLESIRGQTYPNIETLVVVERSPELAEILRQYIAEKGYTNTQVLFREGPEGVSFSRNLGIENAKGDVIAFIDDDALLYPDWAGNVVRTYAEDSTIIGATGPVTPLWEDHRMNWFPREFYWIFSCTDLDIEQPTEVRNGFGTNMSFRREAFSSGQLFKTNLGVKGREQKGWQEPGGEETDFSIRVKQRTGKRIVYSPLIKVQHRVFRYRLGINFIVKRAYWEGYAKAMFKRWYRRTEYEAAVLSIEYNLLRRIMFKLIPGTITGIFKQPVTATRQLLVTLTILSCVTGGYFSYNILSIFGRSKYKSI